MGAKELAWWASAPEWAEWHTWDFKGKTWWSTEPRIDALGMIWDPEPFLADTLMGIELVEMEYYRYDKAPCPVEIDLATTLRKRLTQAESDAKGYEDAQRIFGRGRRRS